MRDEYRRRIIEDEFAELQAALVADERGEQTDMEGGIVFFRFFGRSGRAEPYQAKIVPASYPIGPWDVGFISPDLEGQARLSVPDRDPRFWPFSPIAGLNGGIHVSFPGVYRVFVCHPFTIEYFAYHPEEPWRPDVYGLVRVARTLREAVARAEHFSRWVPLFLNAGGPQ